jgi:adenosylhomocysteine nucleosidase
MRPGIIAAIAAEARILAKVPISAGELIYLPEGSMVSLSGRGANRARSAAQILLEKGATALVSWGFAGGLLPWVSTGSLILPESIIAPDQSVYHVDPVWHERLCSRLETYVGLYRGTIAESAVVLADCAEKTAFFHRTGALAVDMESASIALAAKEARVPFIVIRAILDGMEVVIPRSALNSIDEFGRVHPSRLLSCLVRRPAEFMTLVRLGRNFQAARATLTTVVRQVGCNMLCPRDGKNAAHR